MKICMVHWFLLAAIFPVIVLGQGTVAVRQGSNFAGSAEFSYSRALPPAEAGAPYSGEEVSETVQMLADGTRITRKNRGRRVYRDSAGRTRTERSMGPPQMAGRPPVNDAPVVVEITDPVAGFRYNLDTVHHVAHRVKAQPSPAQSAPPAAGAASPPPVARRPEPVRLPDGSLMQPPQLTTEALGSQFVNGVQADGTRTTTIIPAGSQGNDRPMVTINETWRSPELNIIVLSKQSDPRNGEFTMQILNLSRVEPDPLLFTAPPDYSVVDETGPFTIRYGQ
jgi:hypothetical protein